MQSLSRIIKSTEIIGNEIISPRIMEKLCENIEAHHSHVGDSINIYESIVKNAGVEAEKILKEAKLNAETILNKAKQEANEIMQKSVDDGYQEGYKSGYAEGYEYGIGEADKEANEIVGNAELLLKNVHEEVKKYIKNSEKEIIYIAAGIAKKIINKELSINEEAIISIAENVLSKALDKKQVVLKVNPEDYKVVKNKRSELSIYVENENDLFIVADPYVSRGSFKAESPSGYIDGEIDTQLELVVKNLAGE